MKKSIVALALASTFALPAMASVTAGPEFDINNVRINEDGLVTHNGSFKTVIGKIDENGMLRNKDGHKIAQINPDENAKTNGIITVKTSKGDYVVKIDKDGKVVPSKDIPKWGGEPDNVDPSYDEPLQGNPSVTPPNAVDNNISIDEIERIGEKTAKALGDAGKAGYDDLDNKIASNNQAISKNTQDIDFNRQAIEGLQKEVKELDERIDGTHASMAAVVNARPFVANGQTAFGAGVGFNGDAQAVAIGVAHSFEDTNWSASATMHTVTGISQSDFTLGAGVQYAL